MEEFVVAGTKIRFPYKAYKTQFALIDRALHAVQQKTNALLESPTGTGKTMAILAAVLSWQQTQEQKPPIIYASRTHTQLSQLMSELKTLQIPVLATCLASRSHYCIHAQVSKQPHIDQSCKAAKAQKRCFHYIKAEGQAETIKNSKDLLDVEELVQVSRSTSACAYYTTKRLAPSADLVFCPYNYLLHPSMTSKLLKSILPK
jgi:Rad3-related DNA helicase